MDISEQNSLAKRGYVFIGDIGKGAYSNVKLFYYNKLKQHIAIKIIDKKQVPEEYYTKFLPREVDILYKAKHPNIALCHKVMASSSGKIYISLEYSKYDDVLKHILANSAFDEEKAKYFFKQLLEAISYLHGIGVAHRDLKCENILLTLSDSAKARSRQLGDSINIVKTGDNMTIRQLKLEPNFDPKDLKILLTDFSFARQFKPKELSKTFCGSAVYTSPEIVQGLPYLIEQQDIWSLGIILFIMVCGSMPYNDENLSIMVQEQLAHKINFTPKCASKLSKQCKDLIYKLIQPNTTRRLTIEQVQHDPWVYDEFNVEDIYTKSSSLDSKLDIGKGKRSSKIDIFSDEKIKDDSKINVANVTEAAR